MSNVRWSTRPVIASAVAALWALAWIASPAMAQSTVPNPSVTGPIPATAVPGDPTHAYPFFSTTHDLAGQGYVEEEFFIEGTANRYKTPALATGSVADGDHHYKTRLVVRRPADPRRFNGTVLLEWYNVTNGFDAENTWFFAWEHFLRAGYVWVGVSAQRVGVDRLSAFSPERYGTLDVTEGGAITDDALSYDIYSQAGQAIRSPLSVDVLGGLQPRLIIATGESQSAGRLATYVNSIHPLANLYDGFLLLSSLGNKIRPDLRTPVWKVSTEYDVESSEASARQPDTDTFRSWEVAGTSHVDYHLRLSREPLELRDLGTSAEAALAPTCGVPSIGTLVPTQYVLASAYDRLVSWVKDSTQPPHAPALDVSSAGSGAAVVLARDSLGLVTGGIRLAALAVPTATNVGTNSGPTGSACVRWGYHTPLDIQTLNTLYPSHASYADAVEQVTRESLRDGFILQSDADWTIQQARDSAIGRLNDPSVEPNRPLSDFDRNP